MEQQKRLCHYGIRAEAGDRTSKVVAYAFFAVGGTIRLANSVQLLAEDTYGSAPADVERYIVSLLPQRHVALYFQALATRPDEEIG